MLLGLVRQAKSVRPIQKVAQFRQGDHVRVRMQCNVATGYRVIVVDCHLTMVGFPGPPDFVGVIDDENMVVE